MQQEELIKKLNNKSILIKVNHIKTIQPTALESFQIIEEKDKTFTCIKKSIVEDIEIKNFKTFKGLKTYLIAKIKDYQQCTYTPIEFEIIEGE